MIGPATKKPSAANPTGITSHLIKNMPTEPRRRAIGSILADR
jgi:hypothetical protein